MRLFKTVLAALTALALIATGTFAISRVITNDNEFIGTKDGDGDNPDTDKPVLHDDFDPETNMKDIYVENLGNTDLYVRVKLSEAMSLTSNTWRPAAADLTAHTYGDIPENCRHSNAAGKEFHDYFSWKMGGWKIYKPASSSGGVINDTAVYTEADLANPSLGLQRTPNALIVTADTFLAMSSAAQKDFIGWIYDSDGYAYWSQALKPNSATGLLLHGVTTSTELDNTDYYYVINILVEAVDINDIPMWKEGAPSVDGSGKTHPEATDKGKEVIDIIIGNNGDGGDDTGGDNGGDNGGDPGDGGDNPGEIMLIAPADPDLGYVSYITGDRADEGCWFTSPDKMVTAELDEPGAFRLEDILADMNDAAGLKVTPLEPRYAGAFTIGSAKTFSCPERADKLSILYTVLPDRDYAEAQWNRYREDTLYPITTQLLLETADGRQAVIKVTMQYYWAFIAWEY